MPALLSGDPKKVAVVAHSGTVTKTSATANCTKPNKNKKSNFLISTSHENLSLPACNLLPTK